jgi:guanine nucleotide-binding protein G(i) subunit alpha
MDHYKNIIYANILRITTLTGEKMINNKIKIENSIKEKLQKIIFMVNKAHALTLNANEYYTNEIYESIKTIWKNPEVIEFYNKNKSEYFIFDGSDYFMKNLEKFDASNYYPSNQDIIMCREQNSGICEFDFFENDYYFKIFDVGGSRNEYKKWIHFFFEEINCVIYLVSLSSFDKKMYEDDFTNRLEESINVFDEVVNYPSLSKLKFYLLFNMVDLFDEKMEKNKNLKKYFLDYKINYLSPNKKMKFISKFDLKIYFENKNFKIEKNNEFT